MEEGEREGEEEGAAEGERKPPGFSPGNSPCNSPPRQHATGRRSYSPPPAGAAGAAGAAGERMDGQVGGQAEQVALEAQLLRALKVAVAAVADRRSAEGGAEGGAEAVTAGGPVVTAGKAGRLVGRLEEQAEAYRQHIGKRLHERLA